MLCEMCGKVIPFAKTVIIDGAKMDVCTDCARFGDDYKAPASGTSGPSTGGSRSVIAQRLEKRERRMGTRDIYADAKTVEIIADYAKVIREAREARGMDLEEFSKSISEKKGTIAKIESGKLIPDDKLAKKIEKALDIVLLESVVSGSVQGTGRSSGGMTLGDFIKRK